MATIVNARDVLLQAATTRLETVSLPGNWQTDWSQVIGSGRPSDNADVTSGAINSGVTVSSGGFTLASGGSIKGGKTAYGSGTGFFLGYSSTNYVFDIGSSTNYLRWNGSALDVRGNIVGDSSINITGSAVFEGNSGSSAGYTWTLIANSSKGTQGGVLAYGSSGPAVMASGTTGGGVSGTTTSGTGVSGTSVNNTGVSGTTNSSSAFGGYFENNGGGAAIYCANSFKWGSYTYAAPSGSTTSFMRNDGTWANLTSMLTLVSSGNASAGALLGYLIVNTYGGAGQVKIPYYAL